MTGHLNLNLNLQGEAATISLAETLSLWARPGYLIALEGELGSGKSSFARGFIQSLFKPGESSDVPSPSFSLVQTYDETRLPIFHADLFRLHKAEEIADLGLDELLANHCGLIEWADKMTSPLTGDLLRLVFSGTGDSRAVKLQAFGGWELAVARNHVIADFLATPDFAGHDRKFFEGDASARRYETLSHEGQPVLLMDMPQRPDGPVVKDGKPYSSIAHLAEGITAVVAINRHLHRLGYSAPAIVKADLDHGLALIEPLGDKVYGKMMLAGEDMQVPFETAAALLADMATKPWPDRPMASAGVYHQLQPYDQEALLIEADLLPSWFFPYLHNHAASIKAVATFTAIWSSLVKDLMPAKPMWVLRDFHSPNLIWIPDRQGLARVGLIDTQDAVLGHPAYDLMALAQDARVDVAPEMERHLVQHYLALRNRKGECDGDDFGRAYAILGAQRATKILGIFARLSKRDGKHGYLQHLPRMAGLLRRNLEHPALEPLRQWHETYLPEIFAKHHQGLLP